MEHYIENKIDRLGLNIMLHGFGTANAFSKASRSLQKRLHRQVT